jgi:hypothetical protein
MGVKPLLVPLQVVVGLCRGQSFELRPQRVRRKFEAVGEIKFSPVKAHNLLLLGPGL